MKSKTLWNVAFAGVLVFGSGAVLAKEGCWVHLYDKPDFTGTKSRIDGPSEFPSLTQVGGLNWNDTIESIEVGPRAEVTVYRNEDFQVPKVPVNHPDAIGLWGKQAEEFRGAVQTFYASRQYHHLGEFNLHRQISSFKIVCAEG